MLKLCEKAAGRPCPCGAGWPCEWDEVMTSRLAIRQVHADVPSERLGSSLCDDARRCHSLIALALTRGDWETVRSRSVRESLARLRVEDATSQFSSGNPPLGSNRLALVPRLVELPLKPLSLWIPSILLSRCANSFGTATGVSSCHQVCCRGSLLLLRGHAVCQCNVRSRLSANPLDLD